ncbi:hypothetical protein DL771_009072 [Monosporascus sp. 5C6A]|nr:hypothetical protein DL771_009072 [Monosporascus sp. 5C6A]
MADIYTPPPDSSYLLLEPFYMPTDSGSVWAIAFSSNSGSLVTAALSVVFTVIFLLLWNFACFIALLFPGGETRRRYVALVTLWNSNDAWFAFRELASYTYHYFGPPWGDFAYGLMLAFIAFIVYGGSLALGIIGPSLVQIGNVAPVRPSEVYYPVTASQNDYVGILTEFGLRAPGVLRALGSVEAADVTTRSRVNIHEERNTGTPDGSEPIRRLTYGYSVTGVELGLQHGSDLALTVEGSCITEYGWMPDNQPEQVDVYRLWDSDDPDQLFEVPIVQDIWNAPKASFLFHPDAQNQYRNTGNSSFAVIVWSAHRSSITQGSDPWYATEDRNARREAPYGARFWMRRGRPALSCWQQDRWSYGSQTVNSVFDLRHIPGIRVPQVLLAVLEAALASPVLARLGNASGDSALRSRTTSPNGVIDASASSMRSDIERLLVASFVATRNVFVDATMFQTDGRWRNLVEASNGDPEDGAGDFVVSSPNIQTFSMVGIIVLVVILVALLLIESMITLVIRRHQQPTRTSTTQDNQPPSGNNPNQLTKDGIKNPAKDSTKNLTSNRLIRFKVLSAVQLFRRIYEPEEGDSDASWPCEVHLPEDHDKTNFELAECKGRKAQCNGHIKGPQKLPPQGPPPQEPPPQEPPH